MKGSKKTKNIVVFTMLFALLLVVYVQVQAISSRVPLPPPELPRPAISISGEGEKSLTPTPSVEEQGRLPKAISPEVPKAEVIQFSPDTEGERFEVIIHRGGDSEKVVVLHIPVGVDAEKVLKEYLHQGDTYYNSMVHGGIPLRPRR